MSSHRIAALTLATALAGQLPSSTPLTVDIDIDATSAEGRISPLLYGQFIEFMFEGVKYGLHAELLRDRGFEDTASQAGLSPSWKRYPDDRDDDYALSARRDDEMAYPDTQRSDGTTGRHSLRVDLKQGVVERHGVYQARVPIRQGIEYRGYLWMKTGTFAGAVTIALEADIDGGRVYGETRIAKADGDWTKYTFSLTPGASDPLARFAILVDGQGTLWIDQVSLIPGDAVDDVRADVLEKVKALHPAFIRWPGGNVAQDYRWQWGVGPRDARPTWINLSWRNELEPGDFGTNEFIRFARNAGAEPSITVNVEGHGATADEAAAWVEYCNGPPSSKYGSLRARDGHPEPYRVKYWEIGNEIWGDWVRGHSDASTYARNLGRYVAAMRAVDPSIEVIAVGDNDMAWNRTVIQRAGVPFDYLAIHHYYSRRDIQGDLTKLVARPLHYERFYGEVEALLGQLPADRRPKLAINEWGLDLPESQRVLDSGGSIRGAADERVRTAKRSRCDERRVGPRKRLARRHHTGRPARCVRHADLPRQPAVRIPARRRAVEDDRRLAGRCGRESIEGRKADFSEGREHRSRASADCPDSCQWGGAIVDRGDRASDGRLRDGRQRVRDAGVRTHDARVRSSRARFFARSAKAFGGGRDTHGGAVRALSRGVTSKFS